MALLRVHYKISNIFQHFSYKFSTVFSIFRYIATITMRNEFVEIYVVGDIIKLLGRMQVVTKKNPPGAREKNSKRWSTKTIATHTKLLGKIVYLRAHINLPVSRIIRLRSDWPFEQRKWKVRNMLEPAILLRTRLLSFRGRQNHY